MRSDMDGVTFPSLLGGAGNTLKQLRHRMKKFFSSPAMFYSFGIRVLVHLIYRLRIVGFENIPERGAAIIISNHVSYMDGLIMNTAIKRKVHYIIDEEIYNIAPVKYWLDHAGAIPIRANKSSIKRALRQASDVLRGGGLVFIFPEGFLTYTGNMMRFRFGVEWMLKNDQVPVIPIALKGLWGSILSRKYAGSMFPWFPRSFRRKVTAICGKPIPPEKATLSYMQREIMRLKNSVD